MCLVDSPPLLHNMQQFGPLQPKITNFKKLIGDDDCIMIYVIKSIVGPYIMKINVFLAWTVGNLVVLLNNF